jgi:hypothetical protein
VWPPSIERSHSSSSSRSLFADDPLLASAFGRPSESPWAGIARHDGGAPGVARSTASPSAMPPSPCEMERTSDHVRWNERATHHMAPAVRAPNARTCRPVPSLHARMHARPRPHLRSGKSVHGDKLAPLSSRPNGKKERLGGARRRRGPTLKACRPKANAAWPRR